MCQHSHQKQASSDPEGARLYYEVAGQGHPLLLHAGVADSRMWDDQFAIFSQKYRVIRYDLRGFGRSEVPPAQFSNVEDAAALLKFLHAEQAYVVGISFGGKIALDLTLAHPDQVDALVLVAPSVSGTQPSPAVQQFNTDEEAALERGDLEAATELNLRVWVDGPKCTPEQVNPAVRERVRAMQYHAFTVPFPEQAEELKLAPPAITHVPGPTPGHKNMQKRVTITRTSIKKRGIHNYGTSLWRYYYRLRPGWLYRRYLRGPL